MNFEIFKPLNQPPKSDPKDMRPSYQQSQESNVQNNDPLDWRPSYQGGSTPTTPTNQKPLIHEYTHAFDDKDGYCPDKEPSIFDNLIGSDNPDGKDRYCPDQEDIGRILEDH